MEDIEIYELAGNVLSAITGDLNEGAYADLGGTITLSWSSVPTLNAWAESSSNIDEPPQHKIGIHYELVRQIYRDIEAFCSYLDRDLDKQVFDFWFQDFEQPIEMLPSIFSSEAHRKNMFIAAITWVYFHELGHLTQEHGFIRSQKLNVGTELIEECYAQDGDLIKAEASALYHATEMAADFEAINFCLGELVRHFNGEDLKASIYLFVCGLSCVLYRFHGSKSLALDSEPVGTHPNPLVRLENVIPQIYEFLSIPELHSHIGIELNRKMMLELCNQASSAAGLFWLRRQETVLDKPEDYFLTGNLNRTNGKSYMRAIIDAWDAVEPTVQELRRFGSYFGVLQFSTHTRQNAVG
ncbi:hypothetical protein [Vibrio metschnikovii]|uniref:hypothetical protein n=1 Tax=Vibrio metschnikovii TaxID=28172 RepID=UPI001C30BACA|nr:hypothetical protein [Vibrio metschnikovii]